jgi:hypothetical protein
MLEISFPDLSVRDCGRLAQQLHVKLTSQGLPENSIKVAKGRSDTMDLGTLVQIGHEAFHSAAHAAAFAPHVVRTVSKFAQHVDPYLSPVVLAKDLFHLLRRARSGIKLVGPGGAVLIEAGEITAENLKVAIENVLAKSPT